MPTEQNANVNANVLEVICNATTPLSTINQVIENSPCVNDTLGVGVDIVNCEVSSRQFLPIVDNLMNYFTRCRDLIQSQGEYFAHFGFGNNDKIGHSGVKYLIHSLYNTLQENTVGVISFLNNSMFANITSANFLNNSMFANCLAVASTSSTHENQTLEVVFISGNLAQNNSCRLHNEPASYALPFSEESMLNDTTDHVVLIILGAICIIGTCIAAGQMVRHSTNQARIDYLRSLEEVEMQQEGASLLAAETVEHMI